MSIAIAQLAVKPGAPAENTKTVLPGSEDEPLRNDPADKKTVMADSVSQAEEDKDQEQVSQLDT